MILYMLYRATILFLCHPYIWSTTVLHDMYLRSSNIITVFAIFFGNMANPSFFVLMEVFTAVNL